MTSLYDKSRQLRVHMAIIESQMKFAKDRATRLNKDKSKPPLTLSQYFEKS